MIDTSKLEKLYYSIGEVAEMLGVSKSLIRYWESEFPTLKPSKNSKGDRRFTKKNIEQLNLIFHLVKERGFTIEGAKNEIKEGKTSYEARIEVIERLKSMRQRLSRFRETFE
ncbi:MAG TPA: MerR family transcriptional regulator [Saprospiraceae bacterium]|nr:MerR family transcriptional regulator [Saprospiraceae bacterium]MCB9269219.1 MerR family transcriptional regulator [Lewinellaceae bacterium]HPG05346.1 MerR family transcriptional regulator [Saprospiraceae bacterium]HPQ99181.1 MerR family transcriptional regulator [Saprospiraceae bacterium]HRV84267.1 MerR family transcriptional regulator [Saprospiraceae bacterium]